MRYIQRMAAGKKHAGGSYDRALGRFQDATIDFVLTELEVGQTFADIALEYDDLEKKARNTRNARKAYDTVIRFLPTHSDVPSEILGRLKALKENLIDLGEQF